MSRPLRIEFDGAVYHVTSRGDRREDIFDDDEDRLMLLEVLGDGLARFDASVLAWCLMSNHYHFVLRTRKANLSRLGKRGQVLPFAFSPAALYTSMICFHSSRYSNVPTAADRV